MTSGSAQPVALTASGAPSGVTASLNPASVTAGGSSTLKLTTTSAAAPGTYPIAVTGRAASSTGWTKLTVPFTTDSTGKVTVYVHGWYAQGNVYADDLSVS